MTILALVGYCLVDVPILGDEGLGWFLSCQFILNYFAISRGHIRHVLTRCRVVAWVTSGSCSDTHKVVLSYISNVGQVRAVSSGFE